MYTRCDVGQAWNGTSCTGTRGHYSYQARSYPDEEIAGLGVMNDADGLVNYNASLTSDAPQQFRAIRYCGTLTVGGHGDWYLPSRVEMTPIYENRMAIGGFDTTSPDSWYWTSTQFAGANAYSIYFGPDSDRESLSRKYMGLKMRCVRRQ